MPFRRNHRSKHSNKINPNWAGGPGFAIPFSEQPKGTPTEFDMLVAKRKLENKGQVWPADHVLYQFAKKHRNSRYVPEWLLTQWGMEVKVMDGAGI